MTEIARKSGLLILSMRILLNLLGIYSIEFSTFCARTSKARSHFSRRRLALMALTQRSRRCEGVPHVVQRTPRLRMRHSIVWMLARSLFLFRQKLISTWRVLLLDSVQERGCTIKTTDAKMYCTCIGGCPRGRCRTEPSYAVTFA